MDEIAFSLGPLNFYWYGIIMAAAVLSAALITFWQTRLFHEPAMPIVDLLLISVPVGIVFARMSFVLMDWPLFKGNWAEIFRFWHGGMFFGGALIGAVGIYMFYTHVFGFPFWRWADILAPGLAFGQAVGQWASLMTQEGFGFPTSLAWGVYIDFLYRPSGYEQFDFFHPVFLYESIWNAMMFIVLLAMAYGRVKFNFPKRNGLVFLLYLFLYASGHLYFDSMRLDGLVSGGLYSSKLICLGVMAVTVLLAVAREMETSVRSKGKQ
ncbi:MAG: prolipoprotein diacylglyceryl transferase [Firmicutes bacterium]|nr:prolipoprotein diacylglyceryl transferase [Bacillota bacterium]